MTTNRLAFGINESIPHRNKYQGLIGSLNSVNSNLVVNNMYVNTMTTPDISFSGSIDIIQVNFLTGNTGYFNNLFVATMNVQNLSVGQTLFYTGIIMTSTGVFNNITGDNASFINARINTLTGTNFSSTNMSTTTLNTVIMTGGTGSFGTLNTTNQNITNAGINNITGTNVITSLLAITGGATPQLFLSTGGANLDNYRGSTIFTVTGIGAWTGAINHRYAILGKQVVVQIVSAGYSPLNDVGLLIFSSLPTGTRPSYRITKSFQCENSLVRSIGTWAINTDGTMEFSPGIASQYTTGAVIFGSAIMYNVD